METLLQGIYRDQICNVFSLPGDNGGRYLAQYRANKKGKEQIKVQRGGTTHELISFGASRLEHFEETRSYSQFIQIKDGRIRFFRAEGEAMAKKFLPEVTSLSAQSLDQLIMVCDILAIKAFPLARFAARQMHEGGAYRVHPRRQDGLIAARSLAFYNRRNRLPRPYPGPG